MIYHLRYWGEVCNDNLIERTIGLSATDFWFSLPEERARFKAKLESIAKEHNKRIVFSEHEGPNALKRTIAKATFKLPDGEIKSIVHDFGYGYETDAAEFMFTEGNFACDCNRSILMKHQADSTIPEMPCGYTIKMIDFSIELV